MALLVEFTIEADAFPFGRAVSGDRGLSVRLERMVPARAERFPFFWAYDGDFAAFERHLRSSEIVKHLEALTRVDEHVLYYAEWYEAEETFLNGLVDAGATIMAAQGDATWSFTVRFHNHSELTAFHQFYQDEDFPVRIKEISSMRDEPGQFHHADLDPVQREALLTALEGGSFAVPDDDTVDEVARSLDLSSAEAAEHLETGTEAVLRRSLLGFTAADLTDAADR